MKTLRVFIAAALIVCLTSAAPVFAKSKTTHKSIGKLKNKTLSMTTVKVSWKKHKVDKYVIYKVTQGKDGKEKRKKLKTVSGKKTSVKLKLGKNKEVELYVKGVKKKKHGKRIIYEGTITVYSGLRTPEWSVKYAAADCSPKKIILSFWVWKTGGLKPTGYEIFRKEVGGKRFERVKVIDELYLYSPYWKDTAVEAGKYYYYKVRCYRKSGKKIQRGKMSRAVILGAVNRVGKYQISSETDEDTITLKLTSHALNGVLCIKPKRLKNIGCKAEEKDMCYSLDSYSLDGDHWINVGDSDDKIVVGAGDALWIRLGKRLDADRYAEYGDDGVGFIEIRCEYRSARFCRLNFFMLEEHTAKCYVYG